MLTPIYSSIHRKTDEYGNTLKICNNCKQWKLESEFHKDSKTKDGLATRCKRCVAEIQSKIDRTEYIKQYNDTHKEEHKQYYEKNKEKKKAYQRQYNNEHREYRNKQKKEYYEKNKEEINRKRRERYNKDAVLRLNDRMSNLIYQALKENKNEQHWEDLVGYTINDLKQHLESQFNENMNWDNMGSPTDFTDDTQYYWEIDHIIPKGTFNYTKSTDHDFQICWSLANLRPLYWKDNRSRPKDGSDISEEQKQQILGQKF